MNSTYQSSNFLDKKRAYKKYSYCNLGNLIKIASNTVRYADRQSNVKTAGTEELAYISSADIYK